MVYYILEKDDQVLKVQFDWSVDIWSLVGITVIFLLAVWFGEKLAQYSIIVFLLYSLIRKTVFIKKGEELVIIYSFLKIPLITKRVHLKKRLKYFVRKEKYSLPVRMFIGAGIAFEFRKRSNPTYELVLQVEGGNEQIIQRGTFKRDLEDFFSLTNRYVKNRS